MTDIHTPTRPRQEGPIARSIERQTSKVAGSDSAEKQRATFGE